MLTRAGGYGGHGVCLSQKERFGQVLEDEEGASHGDTLGKTTGTVAGSQS